MTRATYTEIACKSAINRVTGMHFAWSLNPYRGCVHACHYCYARATHRFYDLNADDDFETKIFVKVNLPEVLRHELARPSWAGDRVAIGTATDAYQPCEGRYRITRRALEAFRDFRNPISLVTKSTLVLRDRDLLGEIARDAEATVHFTITTLDEQIWRLVEPGTPPPMQRMRVMRELVEAGVRCGIFIAPVLPGITDALEDLEALISTARAHGAEHVWASPLRLAPLVKEHYFGFVADAYPELLARYRRAYPAEQAPRDYQAYLTAKVDILLDRYGYGPLTRAKYDEPKSAAPPPLRAINAPVQLDLAI